LNWLENPFFINTSNVSGLSSQQYKSAEYRIACDLGLRAGISPISYVIFLLILNVFTELGFVFLQSYWYLQLIFLGISITRYLVSKKLQNSTLDTYKVNLKYYYWLSLVSAFLWGSVVGIMIWIDQMNNFSYLILAMTITIMGASFGTMIMYLRVWLQFVLCLWLPIFVVVLILVVLEVPNALVILFLLFMTTFLVLQAKRLSLDYQTGILREIQMVSQKNELKQAFEAIKEQQKIVEYNRDHLQELVDNQTNDLIIAKEKAEQADLSKTEFLANMTHEFRTPLHAILSFTQCGLRHLDKADNTKVEFFLEKVKNAGNRLQILIDDLLDLASLEANRSEVYFNDVNMTDVILSVTDDLNEKFEAKKIKLIFDIPIIDVVVYADESRVIQILSNLLVNAIQYSPENSNISIFCESEVDQVLLKISDHGPGVPDDEKLLIFNKFDQSSRTRSGAGGTGLGLSICSKIMELHKGKIWVEDNIENENSVGTTFIVMFPVGSN